MSRQKFPTLVQTGLKALALAEQHQQLLDPRLAPGTVDGLRTDITALGVAVPGVHTVHSVSKAATANQNAVVAAAQEQVTAVRTTVKRSGAAAEVRAAYGVGVRVPKKSVKRTKAAIRQIVGRAEAHPEELAALGILPKDLDALRASLAAIEVADAEQEQLRATAPETRRDRDAIATRIANSIARIAGAGIVEFASDRVIRSEFAALLGAGNPKPKPAAPASGENVAPSNG